MIITVGNTKGGTGKSTFAVNLAISLASSPRGLSLVGDAIVLLIDGDEQHSALTFTQLRNESGINDYAAVAITGTSLRFQTRKLAQSYDQVIIDVGGRDTGSFRAALTITDYLLIPVQPRTFDVWAMESLVQLIDEARLVNPTLHAHVVLNLAEVQGHENEEAQRVLSEFSSIEFLDSPIMRRKVYAESIAQGKGILEMKNAKAKEEWMNLMENVYRSEGV